MGLRPLIISSVHSLSGTARSIKQILAVKADLQVFAVSRNGADVVRLADRGDSSKLGGIVSKFAADGAFELFGNDEADALDGVGQTADVSNQFYGVVLRQHTPPIEELTL